VLTPKQEKFCLAYLEIGNASEAYRRAYDVEKMSAQNIWTESSRLLTNPQISARLIELREGVAAITKVSRAWVVEKLVTVVERSPQTEAVMDRNGNETGEYRYDSAGANRALQLLGTEIGMFVERKEIRTNPFDALTYEQVKVFDEILTAVAEEEERRRVRQDGSEPVH
jgi:phage terminase small subunit